MSSDYDVVVVGGGAAGLTMSAVAAGLGAKTLLIERGRLGGDCTWTGCVPSKMLLKAAGIAQTVRTAGRFGILCGAVSVDFDYVRKKLHQLRQNMHDDADSPARMAALGVDVHKGAASFRDPATVEVTGRDPVRGRVIVIATGAEPAVPAIPGLAGTPYLTSESVFELDTLPGRLTVIGAGPVGVELAQAFARLGSSVTVLEQKSRILPDLDAELAARLRVQLAGEGLRLVTGAQVLGVAKEGVGQEVRYLDEDGRLRRTVCDQLLVAAGKEARTSGLGLSRAGVAVSSEGICINRQCRTSVRHIYAIGDVTGRYAYTHMSEHMARVAATNAVLRVRRSLDEKTVPGVVFTDPELAHAGAGEAELARRGIRFATYAFPYSKLDRAVIDEAGDGLIKLFARPATGRILGAAILGERAGELISEVAVAMRAGITLRRLSDTIHPYPTFGQGVRRAADQWYARRASPRAVRLVQRLFRYRGRVAHRHPTDIV